MEILRNWNLSFIKEVRLEYKKKDKEPNFGSWLSLVIPVPLAWHQEVTRGGSQSLLKEVEVTYLRDSTLDYLAKI